MQTLNISPLVNMHILESDKFKTNFLSVNFIIGLEKSTVTNASLLVRVLQRATKKYPSVALISERLEYIYDMSVSTRSYKNGEKLIISYDSDFLKDLFLPSSDEDLVESAVDMFRQIFFEPYTANGEFDSAIVESEKVDLLNSIKAIINNKNAYAKQKCTELMCEGENYSLNDVGYEEDVPSVTGKTLFEFYKEVVNNARVEIFFTGQVDCQKLALGFKDIFSRRNPKAYNIPDTFVSGKARDKVLEVTEKMPVNQGKLAMGFRTGVSLKNEDSAAFYMFCEIFGGSPMSKLFMNVREKLSLCYYCRAAADFSKGVMYVLSGIESCNRNKALEAIKKELCDIQSGKISDAEFNAAKMSITNGYKELEDNPTSLMNWYLSRILAGVNSAPVDVIEKINMVTKEQVAAAARKAQLDTVFFLEGTN